jgi:hypothetical protein
MNCWWYSISAFATDKGVVDAIEVGAPDASVPDTGVIANVF